MPAVRTLLISVAVAGLLAGAGAGCGGGDDGEDAVADGTTSSTETTVAPEESTTTAAADGGTAPAAPDGTLPALPEDTTPIDPATVETLPPAADVPSDPGFPPADPGRYTYRTTGTANGTGVDRSDVFTVTSLGPSDVRYATPEMVLDLQYRADGVYLRQLTAKISTFQIAFQSAEGALLIPIPPDPGRSWEWTLRDTAGGLTAHWRGTTQPAETAADGSGPFPVIDGTVAISGTYDTKTLFGVQHVAGSVAFRLWVDPALRLPRQLRQVTTITQPSLPGLGGDTTSTYTGFTPA